MGCDAGRAVCLLVVMSLVACAEESVRIEPTLESNPTCSLSGVVRWTTDAPATSWVHFGEGDVLTHRIGDDTPTTEHEVIVVGMHANASYALQAVSETETGEELHSDPLSFETGALPHEHMVGEVDVLDEARVEDGWTLANLADGIFAPTLVLMLDLDGRPVWYHQYGDLEGRADIEASLDDDGHVLIGPGVANATPIAEVDLLGNVVWEGPEQPDLGSDTSFLDLIADGVMHHTLSRLDAGGYLTVVFDYREDVIGDEIWQLDPDGELAWSWNAFDHLEVDPDTLGLLNEWTHLNSFDEDPQRDVLYANSWNLDRVFQIDQATGDILWAFGPDADFAADPDAEWPWFEGAHSVEYVGDDRLLLYDNGAHGRGFSRLVEYQLDPAAMTTELVWQYPDGDVEDEWYNYSWGDVDPLPNGNRLMVAGNAPQGYDHSRIAEVTPEGDLVWQLWWFMSEDEAVGSFHAQRIPALAEPL